MRTFVSLVVGVAASASAQIAQAQNSVEMLRLGNGLGRIITLSGSQVHGSFTFPIGQLTHQFRNGIGEGVGLTGVIQTFCIDIKQDSSTTWEVFNIVPLTSAPMPGPLFTVTKAQAIADVWFGAEGQQFTSPDYAAALQMMIWEIGYDYDGTASSIDVSTGTVRFSSQTAYFPGVLSVFETLKGKLGIRGSIEGLRALVNPNFQDQLVLIPTPGAVSLAACALILAAGRRRR